jgi:hypothetical protein
VQKVLLFVLLILLYIFAFGLTKIFAFIFKMQFFDKKFISKYSFWEKMELNPTKESFFHQI